MDADTLQELRAVRAILGAFLLRRRFGLGEHADAVERAKAILDAIVRRQEGEKINHGNV